MFYLKRDFTFPLSFTNIADSSGLFFGYNGSKPNQTNHRVLLIANGFGPTFFFILTEVACRKYISYVHNNF